MPVGRTNNDILQGTLDLLVLKSLVRGPLHGFGIAAHIQRASDEVLRVEEGSLYPALHRIEQAGWITSEWGTSDNNRRARFYRLTAAGRKQLSREEKGWDRLTRAVEKVLRFA
jgi:transcriptional regulator